MNRKDFIKKGLLGTGIFASSSAIANVVKNDIDELATLEIIGFNHMMKAFGFIKMLGFTWVNLTKVLAKTTTSNALEMAFMLLFFMEMLA